MARKGGKKLRKAVAWLFGLVVGLVVLSMVASGIAKKSGEDAGAGAVDGALDKLKNILMPGKDAKGTEGGSFWGSVTGTLSGWYESTKAAVFGAEQEK